MIRKSIIILLLINITACTTASIVGRGSTPILLNTPDKKVKVIENFEDGYISAFNYGKNYDIGEIISDQLKNKDVSAVTNVKVTIKQNFWSVLLNIITLNIAQANKIEITGELVKYSD